MLAGIYYGAQYGGSTTAILVNLPGESSSVVTAIDGYQMARNGQAGLALATAALASFLAGTIATFVIALAAPALAEVALKFGPADYFSLMVFGLVAAVILAHGSVVKAIGMILVGMLLGTIGIDVNTSVPRYTFGIPQFGDGIDFAVIAMGIFGIGETIANLERTGTARVYMERIKNLWPRPKELRAMIAPAMRGTLLGSALGILPGGGPVLASFSAYALEKKVSSRAERFGKGAHRRRRRPRGGQQRRGPDLLHPAADAGCAFQRGHGADDRRADDAGTAPRTAAHARKARAVLGPRRQHVDRQSDAGDPEPAAGRHLGQDADRALPLPLSGDPPDLLHRRLQRQQQRARRADRGRVRLRRLSVVSTATASRRRCCSGFILGPLIEENLRRALLISHGSPAVFVDRPISATFLVLTVVLVMVLAAPMIRAGRERVFRESET